MAENMDTPLDKPATFDLFAYQKNMLPVLLGWAAGSVAMGGFWRMSERPILRGLGTQFIAWGLIDGLIALFGIRSAAANAAKFRRGEISQSEMKKQTHIFRRILWLNTALDIGYVLFGRRMVRRAAGDGVRRGGGVGVIVQGAFLLVWDLLLLLSMGSNPDGD